MLNQLSLLFSLVVLLKPFELNKIILIHEKNDELFLKSKNPGIYNVNNDSFDSLGIEERAELCDEVLNYPIFSFTQIQDGTDGDPFEFEYTIPDNYQHKSSENKSIPEEKNVVEPVGIKLMNEMEPRLQPLFKRFLCSTIDSKHEFSRGDLYLSSGLTKDSYFLLIRRDKEEHLRVYGIVDPTEVEIDEETGTADLINNLVRNPMSTATLNEAVNFEICSKVHNFAISSPIFEGMFVDRNNDHLFWDHYAWIEDGEDRCQKRNVRIENVSTIVGDELTESVDTVWCEFNGGLIQKTELYISIKSINGNFVTAIVLVPSHNNTVYMDDDYIQETGKNPSSLTVKTWAKFTLNYL